MEWKAIAAEKKSRIDAAIPTEWRIEMPQDDVSAMAYPKESGLLTAEELAITESSATDIVKKIAAGDLTSVAVTTAFCKRAALAHQLVNCSLEFFPETGLARAKELDEYYAQNKKTVGPLHGLPISLKDQFRIKGLETTMGYVDWIGKYETDESVLVTLLHQAGAVFYVKTSVPQSLMACETFNNIIGRTVNPRNKNWSCGGSSGGEGALVSFRGGIIGVGTDIVLEQQPWLHDSKVIPMPWRQAEEDAVKSKIASGGLTLGFYACDGNVLPHPPIIRAVETVVEKVRNAGHSVIAWEPYKHPHAVELINRIYASDGGTDIFDTLKASGEPAIPHISALIDPSMSKIDINEVWDAQLEKWKYQCEYLAAIQAFEKKHGVELDAIIAPITPTAAIRHDQFKYYGYASAVNLLDFTSVVVPVSFADKTIDIKNAAFKPLTEIDNLVQAEYDPEAYEGAPTAVQIIGRRLTEERVMAIAEEIGRLLENEVAS
ncbi:hypothetical protein G7Z17_g3548 [Cylindrodendrum hubeiense]|uniref:Amidase domain-containing protein n=1 Tax=Cylindrodendrum hubeiense TaxID=595255 RepID=A0A9P5HGN7_9HYPO|nr:hypothetical protein G7Z17_g3548 [Cylindrodendrum hubeiense]